MLPLLDEHELWEPLTAYMFQVVTTGPRPKRSTPRLEVRDPGTFTFRAALLAMQIRCVACGNAMHPVRERDQSERRMFVTVTCEDAKRPACHRCRRGRDEYDRIVAKFRHVPHGAIQKELFGVFK